mgnify:CR=1 FL=1
MAHSQRSHVALNDHLMQENKYLQKEIENKNETIRSLLDLLKNNKSQEIQTNIMATQVKDKINPTVESVFRKKSTHPSFKKLVLHHPSNNQKICHTLKMKVIQKNRPTTIKTLKKNK